MSLPRAERVRIPEASSMKDYCLLGPWMTLPQSDSMALYFLGSHHEPTHTTLFYTEKARGVWGDDSTSKAQKDLSFISRPSHWKKKSRAWWCVYINVYCRTYKNVHTHLHISHTRCLLTNISRALRMPSTTQWPLAEESTGKAHSILFCLGWSLRWL